MTSSYERLKKFLASHPGYMAARMRIVRGENPDYYSRRSVAQRLRRKTEREAAKAVQA